MKKLHTSVLKTLCMDIAYCNNFLHMFLRGIDEPYCDVVLLGKIMFTVIMVDKSWFHEQISDLLIVLYNLE
jgi:hypothetical protein